MGAVHFSSFWWKRDGARYINFSWVNALEACKANKLKGQYSGLDELLRKTFTWHILVWLFFFSLISTTVLQEF